MSVSHKIYLKRFQVLVILALVLSMFGPWQATQVFAGIPAGYSEYFIPGSTDQLFQILKDIDNDPDLGNALGGGGVCVIAPCNRMHNVITISVAADNVTVYYDHWEDGYGSGNTGNYEVYVANKGDVLTFESANIPVPRAATDTCTSTNPNGASTACYDGRDRIYVAGGAVSVAEAFWPEVTGTVFANAWEVYPIKPYQTDYTIPVGENLSVAPYNYTDFSQVFVIVQGTQDNTSVQIDNPGTLISPDVNTTLNRGDVTQLYHINSATTVHASAPVQVQFIVGQFHAGINSDSRSYTAVPSSLWESSYYSPVSGFANANTDAFIYNPTGTPLTINYQDRLGSGSFNVPANSTRSYRALAGRFIPTDSALYLASADGVTDFWAIGSVDTGSPNYNYGFTMIPPGLLTEEYYVSWAPGTTNLSANGSPVYVTPTTDNTTVFVDYSPANGVAEATFTLNRIERQKIFDPDRNNTGMHIWATGPIAVVWGEDPDTAAIGNPYIDAGYAILPLNPQWITTVLTMDKTADPAVVAEGPDQTSVFTLVTKSDAFGIDNVSVVDNLPPYWAYVAGSTTITLPGGSTMTGTAADPTVNGSDLTWDKFPVDPLNMRSYQTLTIAYTARTTGTPPLDISTNKATATGVIGGETFSASDSATITHIPGPALTIFKSVAETSYSMAGAVLHYSYRVTNTGTVTLYGPFTVADDKSVDESCTTTPPTLTLAPGAFITCMATYQVTPADIAAGSVTNIASASGLFDDGGGALAPVHSPTDTKTVNYVAPPTADLSLTKTVDNSTPLIGATVTFTVTVTNAGPDPATGVQVGDLLPAGFTFVSSTPSAGSYASGTGIWNIGDLAVSASATLAITATVNSKGPYVNTAQVILSDQVDPDSTPNDNNPREDDQASVTVTPAQGNITKSVNKTSARIGEIVTYEVSAIIPPGVFDNVALVDTMDRGLSFVACDSITAGGLNTSIIDPSGLLPQFQYICANPTVDSNGSADPVDVGRRVTFDFDRLENSTGANQTLTVTYRAVVLDSAGNQNGVNVHNSAQLSWTGSNNPPVSRTIRIVEPELSIGKTSNNTFIANGTTVTFFLTIQHTAASAADAYDVVITDTLPVSLDFVTGSLDCTLGAQDPAPADCTYDSGTRTIRAIWDTFKLMGGKGQISFQARGNANLSVDKDVTNIGSVEWSSLLGDFRQPQSPNKFSTERYYDPNDPNRINVFGASASLHLSPLGGKGRNDDRDDKNDRERGDGNRNGGNAQGTGGFYIPITGFAPGRITDLSSLPVARYDTSLDLSLEIPVLKINIPIIGAPLKNGTWDVSWLTNQAGWLEKTAFPGFPGNSVLTGHVTSSYGVAGPFAGLNKLQEGDLIFVHVFGQTQIYKVQIVKKVQPDDISVLKHQEKPWLTLLTCADYDEKTNMYLSRIVVEAELVEVRN